MATKPVHLELISDLSTATFLFAARCGYPSEVYSDNKSILLVPIVSHRSYIVYSPNRILIKRMLSSRSDNKSNIPGRASHFGGLWEATVKAAKALLRKLWTKKLTWEEHYSTLTNVELRLNSRPLFPYGDNVC